MKSRISKFILILILVSNITVASVNNQTQTTFNLPNLLIELETTIFWNAVANEWKFFRVKWLDACKLCTDGQCVAQKMIEFESYSVAENMSPSWQQRRETWIKECELVKTNAQAVKLLLEFEENVSWNAVKETWKERRTKWINECTLVK